MLDELLPQYLVGLGVSLVLLSLADALAARGPSPAFRKVVLLNVLFSVAATMAGVVVVATSSLVLLVGAAALLYALKGRLYATFGLAFAAPRTMKVLSLALAFAPVATIVSAFAGYNPR